MKVEGNEEVGFQSNTRSLYIYIYWTTGMDLMEKGKGSWRRSKGDIYWKVSTSPKKSNNGNDNNRKR